MKAENQEGVFLSTAPSAAAYAKARARLARFVAIRMATTRRLARRGRRAAEELLDDAEQRIRHKPLRSVGVFFAVGVGIGTLMGWLSVRRRD